MHRDRDRDDRDKDRRNSGGSGLGMNFISFWISNIYVIEKLAFDLIIFFDILLFKI